MPKFDPVVVYIGDVDKHESSVCIYWGETMEEVMASIVIYTYVFIGCCQVLSKQRISLPSMRGRKARAQLLN